MNYEEAKRIYDETCEPFDLINLASESARPEVVRDWFQYEEYRPTYAAAWAAMMGSEADAFEAGSAVDGLAYGAFLEGWSAALRRVGGMLGINPDVFRAAVECAAEAGVELLPEGDIVRLQSVRPLKPGADDVGRYYADIEAATLGGRALCAP